MNNIKRFPLLMLFLIICSCQLDNERQNSKISTLYIKHKGLKISNKSDYDAEIFKEDYDILKKLRELGSGSFYIKDFHLFDAHVSYLRINEKKNILDNKKKMLDAKSLISFLFSKDTIGKLGYLEILYLQPSYFKGKINICANLNKLKFLSIYGSFELKGIYFQTPMNIKYLRLPKNRLRSINASFKNLIALKELNLHNNDLKDLDLSYIPWVNRVDISDNPISFDKIDSLRLKYPEINIVSYSYKKKRPGNYIDRSLETPVYE